MAKKTGLIKTWATTKALRISDDKHIDQKMDRLPQVFKQTNYEENPISKVLQS